MEESELLKNTVSAKGQLEDTEFTAYHEKENAAYRVLFVGNSITRHGVLPSIGWYGDYGMAASCAERDYVHLVLRGLEEKYGAVSYCIAQAAEWERHFNEDDGILDRYFAGARDFRADAVIIRIGENISRSLLAENDLAPHFRHMVDYFRGSAAKTVVTDLFWSYSPIDTPIREVCQADGSILYVPIGEFGRRDDCKALGEYEHQGVARHPNDRGMEMIANAILTALEEEK